MRAVRGWVVATFILAFLVIIAGGVVRTTQSGMGCPDWPRCFGMWIPPTDASELPPDFEKYLRKQDIDHSFNAYHTWIEYINRLFGVLLGVFGIIQVAVLFRKRKMLPLPWKLSKAFLIVVILTGLFGALVVKFNLAHLSISVHLLFAVLLIQIQLALVLAVQSKLFVHHINPNLRKLLIGFLLIVFIQSIMGTMVRMFVDDVSRSLDYQFRETWLENEPVVFLVHRTFSWLILAAGLYLSWIGRRSVLKNNVFFLTAIVVLSMITGIVLSYAGMPALAQPVHLVLATAAITQCLSILLQTRKEQRLTQ